MNLLSSDPGFIVASGAAPARWRFGNVELDEHDESLRIDGSPVPMDRSSVDLLRCLLTNAGETVSKEALLRAGWPGRVVTENSLAKAIGRLRQVLDDPDGELLRVVHGYGYRLVASVENIATSAADPPTETPPIVESAPLLPAGAAKSLVPRLRWPMVGSLAVLLALAAVATWIVLPVPAAHTQLGGKPVSIAVLPFVDLSPEHNQQHFADGLAEQLLDDLAQIPQLKAVARTSSFAFRNQVADVLAIGKKLNVDTVLEGSVRKSDDRIRVTVQLIDTTDGYHLWSRTYDRPIAELFAMQDELTRAIVSALRIELLPEQRRNLSQRGTSDAQAYHEYLLAHEVFKDDETANRRSIAHLEHAVAIDPHYVNAWLMLADLLSYSGLYADSAEEALAGKRRAMEILDQVIAESPDRADPYFLRAERKYAHWWDWAGARVDLELGKARSSADTDMYLRARCRLEAALGDLPAAIALAQRATQLDPESGWAWTVMGYHYVALGDFDRARDALTQAIRIQPLDEHAHYYLGLADLLQGRTETAIPHFDDSAHVLRLTGLALARHTLGDAAASERELQLLIQRYGHILPYQAAEVYAWRGEKDQAFAWLDRAYALHDASFMYLEFDPLLANLRSDRRFASLLTKLNLPLVADAAH
ncbi:MAG TPA: winged helix-turn-helix domain-containing protein [Rudaea sp.]|nr:winged helix-turn-helix domain-containing protein [Rudaea sp.]